MKANIALDYMDGLKKAYIKSGAKKEWNDFEKVMEGACESDIAALKEVYPNAPNSLIELLKIVDGTYWREYQGKEIAFYLLGSDIEEYPYYLLSAKQIVETQNEAYDYYADYVNREFEPEDIPIDERIIDDAKKMRWLHFSDCMNNGGTSQLFIDFSPSDKGVIGQVVRFLHDPDEIEVIADSFDEYLQMLMDGEYNFISEEDMISEIEEITDKEEFISFLGKLLSDYHENPQEWENKNIDEYIGAMKSWIEDYSSSDFNDIDWNNIDYSTMAKILYMGKLYE